MGETAHEEGTPVTEPVLLHPDAHRLAEWHERFRSDPGSVAEAWQRFFRDLDDGATSLLDALRRGDAIPQQRPANGAGGAAVPSADAPPGRAGTRSAPSR